MTGFLQTMGRVELDPAWRWYSAIDRCWVHPSEMETRHLFFTFRMIWNHSMPPEWEVGYNVKRHEFGKRYTPEYMKQAVAQIGRELATRTDIDPLWQDELDQMAEFLKRAKLAAQGFAVYDEVPHFMIGDKDGKEI